MSSNIYFVFYSFLILGFNRKLMHDGYLGNHPNVYKSVCYFKEILVESHLDYIAFTAGNLGKKQKTVALQMKKRRWNLMESLYFDRIELPAYLHAIGVLIFRYDNRGTNKFKSTGPEEKLYSQEDESGHSDQDETINQTLDGSRLRESRKEKYMDDIGQTPKPKPSKQRNSNKKTLEEGWQMVPERLQQLNMELSPTQRNTRGTFHILLAP